MDLESETTKAQLDEVLDHTLGLFLDQFDWFERIVQVHSEICGNPGFTDDKMTFATTMAHQVTGEYSSYFMANPDDRFQAVAWLQKAFVLCRIFDSESLLESKQKGRRIGDLVEPESGKTYGELTRLTAIDLEPSRFGKVAINEELQRWVKSALDQGDPIETLKLLCDSVKHGVLSPAINLVHLKTSRQIYLIGLLAMAKAVNSYCTVASSLIERGSEGVQPA